ncbi:TetR/AcrR family transcriptional regulator [Tsukamurella sp. 8F]|uniref:TetR/AcrR family transcriptional regulator n=1 Tax=unclassified Tsukamurella TaxID=2633480 RepID=UPI0023B93A93|nr:MULTISPECIES: TetR/AcrR family transcriptional regulator [unclassified Tsukamurella]MDF0530396.1 TetR/AcrR family transcriptional regulator [Tsukamurella sp. 8J]MDF0587783.1 TetR/AcrR family transcriptional regulator [Tsukamurella sp. 8F]
MSPGATRRRDPVATRRAIITAALDALSEGRVGEGRIAPTTKEIAARAGTSERSVFVHFPTLDDLRTAVADEQATRVERTIRDIDPSLPLPQRVDAVVRQSADIFELQRNPRLAGLIEMHRLTAIDQRMRVSENKIRDALTRTFAAELASDRGVDSQLLDCIDVAIGWSTHHYLEERRRLSRAATHATITRILMSLLGPPQPDDGSA